MLSLSLVVFPGRLPDRAVRVRSGTCNRFQGSRSKRPGQAGCYSVHFAHCPIPRPLRAWQGGRFHRGGIVLVGVPFPPRSILRDDIGGGRPLPACSGMSQPRGGLPRVVRGVRRLSEVRESRRFPIRPIPRSGPLRLGLRPPAPPLRSRVRTSTSIRPPAGTRTAR